MKALLRKILIFTAITLLLAVLLPGCGTQAENAARNFLSDFTAGEYSSCYAVLSKEAKEKITEEEFVQKLTSIYKAIGVKSVEFSGLEQDSETEGVYNYTLTYDTELAGKLEYAFSIRVPVEDGKYRIDWNPGHIFPGMEWGDSVRIIRLNPARGEIFAADGTLLAANQVFPCVYASVDKVENAEETANTLAPLLSMDSETLLSLIQSEAALRDGYAVLKVFDNEDLTEELTQSLLAIPGIGIDRNAYARRRYYPYGKELAHTIGYVGKLTPEEYEKNKSLGYSVDDYIGKSGLEAKYEAVLRGEPGYEIIIVDGINARKSSIYKKPAVNGRDLRLSVDIKLQTQAYSSMEQFLKDGQSGAVIVLDPVTGQVRAIANYPSFDANLFVKSISKADWDALNDPSANRPLFNRALSSLMPPGSIIKPFTAAIGLEKGTITPNTVFDLKIVDDRWSPDWANWVFPIKRVEAPDHKLNLSDCMVWSDNIYFAYLGIKIGAESLVSYFESLGIGEAVTFDLTAAKSQVMSPNSTLNEKMLADSAFGQGELQVTPLQVAAMYTAFRSGGNIIAPRIVDSICHAEGKDYITDETFETKIWKTGVIKPETIEILEPVLEKVIENGTGQYLRAKGITVAGKTGTAEIDNSREISWIAGYWVDGREERLVLVMVDGPPDKGNVKFDIARPLLTLEGR